ncbi:MAG TPA: alpha/beta hydrolase [Micromonosporaceae bacterium]
MAGVLLLALVSAGCSIDVRWRGKDDASGPTSGLAWRDCKSEAKAINSNLPVTLKVECATVKVPQDWHTAVDGRAADGQTFDIALMRMRSTRQADRVGSLLVNPGGPGGSGIEYLAYAASRLTGLLARFDVVGFDPRGVGRSSPVKCISDADLDAAFGSEPDPVSEAAFQDTVALTRRIGEECGRKVGDDLRLFSTEQAARDMDAIRQALGEAKINYLGYSYGTLLGAVYAELFGKNVRAMVLDGAVDPQQSPVASSEGQAMGFERALNNFATWCRRSRPTSCPIGPDAKGAILAAIDTARTNPVTGAGGRKATAGWVFYAMVSSLYAEEGWQLLAEGIDNLRRGDPRLIFFLADSYGERDESGHYSNLFDANSAVNCADSDQYPTVEQVRALQSQWRSKYPVFGAPLAIGLLSCSLWPAKKDPYPVGPATGAPPIVVVGTTGDPATPYESTAKLASMLGTGTVVTWQGEGHTAYPETTCIRKAVDDYFISLTVPAKGLTCPAR